jgi:hypothetical protein
MRATGLFLCALIALTACGEDTSEFALQTPDRLQFELEVYPVLLRDCGFNACHASSDRFFQVFGSGRARLLPATPTLDLPTPEEIGHAYERARSMIDAADPEQSLLLRKPLATAAGGTGHEGVDALGRNVYQSKLEPGYLVLSRWVLGQPAVPGAPPPQP